MTPPGRTRVLLGGPDGRAMSLGRATSPCCRRGRTLPAPIELLVVGAYPPGQDADICREAPTPEISSGCAALPAPASDPVGHPDGVTARWRCRLV